MLEDREPYERAFYVWVHQMRKDYPLYGVHQRGFERMLDHILSCWDEHKVQIDKIIEARGNSW